MQKDKPFSPESIKHLQAKHIRVLVHRREYLYAKMVHDGVRHDHIKAEYSALCVAIATLNELLGTEIGCTPEKVRFEHEAYQAD